MIKQKRNLSKPNTPPVLVEAHFLRGGLFGILGEFGCNSGKSFNKVSSNSIKESESDQNFARVAVAQISLCGLRG